MKESNGLSIERREKKRILSEIVNRGIIEIEIERTIPRKEVH